jgi:hypothetical protein
VGHLTVATSAWHLSINTPPVQGRGAHRHARISGQAREKTALNDEHRSMPGHAPGLNKGAIMRNTSALWLPAALVFGIISGLLFHWQLPDAPPTEGATDEREHKHASAR